jgi:glyoxylate reductase
MDKKVFVTHQLPGEKIHALGQLCDMNVWMGPGLLPGSALGEELSECQGLVCLLTDRVDRSLLDSLPNLEFVSSMSAGVDHVDVAALTERGIPLGHTPGVLVDTTADATFALLLSAARRVVEADRYIRQGNWRNDNAWSPEFFTGKDVSGATLGIIGLGEIGQAVAKRAASFGMHVLAYSRSAQTVEGIENVSLDELLLRSDFVSLHVPLNNDTRNLMNADRIAMMKPGAVLVNTARGGIVDETALAKALSSGALYAAAFDVFAREPVEQENPLLALPNVVVAPHIGSATILTRIKMANLAADNAIAALGGQRMPFCVNPEVYG